MVYEMGCVIHCHIRYISILRAGVRVLQVLTVRFGRIPYPLPTPAARIAFCARCPTFSPSEAPKGLGDGADWCALLWTTGCYLAQAKRGARTPRRFAPLLSFSTTCCSRLSLFILERRDLRGVRLLSPGEYDNDFPCSCK